VAVAVPAESRLSELEAVIERGIDTFVEVGTALREIRDAGLYRHQYNSFEDYCRERWGMSRPRAYQYIQAAEIVAALPVSTTVDNEAQARELMPLRDDPEAMAGALARAQEIAGPDPITAADVRQPIDPEMWRTLKGVIDALAAFAANDAARIAATVPDRRRAATARRLRQLGTYLGRIAWLLEGQEGNR
jgi:hypothetical protein